VAACSTGGSIGSTISHSSSQATSQPAAMSTSRTRYVPRDSRPRTDLLSEFSDDF
jgi:hypothetical protein